MIYSGIINTISTNLFERTRFSIDCNNIYLVLRLTLVPESIQLVAVVTSVWPQLLQNRQGKYTIRCLLSGIDSVFIHSSCYYYLDSIVQVMQVILTTEFYNYKNSNNNNNNPNKDDIGFFYNSLQQVLSSKDSENINTTNNSDEQIASTLPDINPQDLLKELVNQLKELANDNQSSSPSHSILGRFCFLSCMQR